jgi:hypothetical protein
VSATPRTDAAKRKIDGFADEWVPRYITEELERERDMLAGAARKVIEAFSGGGPLWIASPEIIALREALQTQ